MISTRKLEPSDAEVARAVVRKFHHQEVSTGYMVKFLSNPANFLIAAEAETEIIGFLSAHALDDLSREAAAMFLYEVEVASEHYRKGAGAALIDHIRKIAQELQMFEMFVFTNYANTGAVAFYKAAGGHIEEGDELMYVYPLTGCTLES